MYPFKGTPMFNPSDRGHPVQPPDPVILASGAGLIAPPPPILNTQWPLNKAAYQDLANDQVDWAALAQQWIHMKETCTTEDLLAAPPPPIISHSGAGGSSRLEEEKGEAPMEMDRDDEETIAQPPHTNPFSAPCGIPVLPRLNQPPPNWNPTTQSAVAAPVWQQTPPPNAVPNNHWNKKQGWNTWTNPNLQQAPPHLAHLMPPGTSGNNHPHAPNHNNWPQRGSHPNHREAVNRSDNQELYNNSASNSPSGDLSQMPVALDAAKRKTLPTWIRLGLEKMEREKQKSIEQDERDRLNREKVDKQKQELLAISSEVTLGTKSKFDSDSEDSSDNDAEPGSVLLRKDDPPKRVVPTTKSKQEQLQELMLLVRSTLTEILLEVTNEEIRTIATETLSKVRQKARTAQTVKKSALTSLTGGLGLGIYADSDGSDDEAGTSGDDSHNGSESNAGDESDMELRETIKRRKKMFEERTKEIEAHLAVEAERERRWLEDEPDEAVASTSVVASMGAAHSKLVANSRRPLRAHDTDIGEVQQHEQKFIPNHARPTERKVSRFSDPKDTVKNIQLTHGSLIYETSSTKALTITPQPNPSGAPHQSDSDAASVASSSKTTSALSSTRRKNEAKRAKRYRDSDDESDSSRKKRSRKEKRRHRSRSRSSSSSSDRSSRRRAESSRKLKIRRSSRDSRVSSSRSSRRSESREKSKSRHSKRSERRRSRSRSKSRDRRHHRY